MLDVDDTILIHGKENLPSSRVTEVIALAQKKIHVCLATARTRRDCELVLDHLSLSGPCVLTNGTQIYDPVAKKIVKEVVLPRDICPALFAICKKHSLKPTIYDGTQDIQYSENRTFEKILSIYIPEIDMKKVDDLATEFSIDPTIHVQKLTAWDKQFMSLDITSNKASKQTGILDVAKILGISTEEIIGVGDGYNDFPLLMACGLKIAMGNAVPELKAIADFIAPSVQEDGVVTVIEKFVLPA